MSLKVFDAGDLEGKPVPERRHRDGPLVDHGGKSLPLGLFGEQLERTWWRGRQWAVTEYGLECLDGNYTIEKDRLTEDLGKEDYGGWSEHIGNKTWADTDDFITAWMIGLLLHGYQVEPAKILKAIGFAPPQDWNAEYRAAGQARDEKQAAAASARDDTKNEE